MKIRIGIFSVIILIIGLLLFSSGCEAKSKELIIGSTTSIVDSGLMDVLAQKFNGKYGYVVKPVSVGTGEALKMGSRGDCDLVIVHSRKDELKFVEEGFGMDRTEFMYNKFVLVGPADDHARVKGLSSIKECFSEIAANSSNFMSRGDDSGTYRKELSIWESIGVDAGGSWYKESGQGMADTLLIANQTRAYVLTDMGTYLTLKDQLELIVLYDGDDESLKNVYSAIAVNPDKFKFVNYAAADKFIDFLVSGDGRDLIAKFGVKEYGQQLFYTTP